MDSYLFKPPWWAKNRHIQTVWGALFRQSLKLPQMQRLRLELDDGDFIDVDTSPPGDSGVVMLLHGLEGSAESHYIRGVSNQLVNRHYQVAIMHFRSCSGENNRLLRSYHSGVSEDLETVLEMLYDRQIEVAHIVGFSLGGNVLLKWLGEKNKPTRLKSAVAVSVPFLLDECANAIDEGFSKQYSKYLLKSLKQKAKEKKQRFGDQLAIEYTEINALDRFWEFDDKITAPINGFDGVMDYYNKVSSRQFLPNIRLPTLIIHAEDDPFMNTKVIPSPAELSPQVEFELHAKGGHVGFVMGNWPWRPEYYLDRRILKFIDSHNGGKQERPVSFSSGAKSEKTNVY